MIFGRWNARKRRPAKPVGFSNRNTFAYDSKFVCSKGYFSQKIKAFENSRKGVRMMNKTKAEIEQMASFICREKGQYMFNKKEIGIITGLCKDKVAELCENIPAACDSRVKLYFIKDVLNYLYNSWLNK